MWKILLLFVLALVAADTLNNCCEPGNVLVKKKVLCWDPKLNVTSNITALDCKIKVKVRYHIDDTGNVVVWANRLNVTYTGPAKKFCVSNQTTFEDQNLENVTQMGMMCADSEEKIVDNRVSGYSLVVSVIFLYITAFIYIALPELRDLQGKSIISFCVTLGTGMLVMALMKLMTYTDMNLCAVRGFLAYFLIVSGFFWTNAISIQILLCIRRPSIFTYELKDFLLYAAYAWGIPALLTVILAIVNFSPGNHIKPGIGFSHCWFFDIARQWYYMFSIMSILIIANIAIFLYTAFVLWRTRFTSGHSKALKYKFMMTLRLFILMGVAWIFEMISSLFEETLFWALIDIYNLLSGFLIFLTLVPFRRRTVKAMHKHGWLDCVAASVERHLAVVEDEEHDVIEHTRDVQLEDTK